MREERKATFRYFSDQNTAAYSAAAFAPLTLKVKLKHFKSHFRETNLFSLFRLSSRLCSRRGRLCDRPSRPLLQTNKHCPMSRNLVISCFFVSSKTFKKPQSPASSTPPQQSPSSPAAASTRPPCWCPRPPPTSPTSPQTPASPSPSTAFPPPAPACAP